MIKNKSAKCSINSNITEDSLVKECMLNFENKTDFEETHISLTNFPFIHGIFKDVIKDDHFISQLEKEIEAIDLVRKNNDLYNFNQSDDLKTLNKPHLKAIRNIFNTQVRDLLKKITSFDLNEQLDTTISRYDETDVLLCHDDELETRKIAFVWYLTPEWSSEDGGALDLFNMDDFGQPKSIVKSILPIRNSLVWFEVSPSSHHQVAEVLSETKSRLSINGWYHTSSVTEFPRHVELHRESHSHISIEEDEFLKFINPLYLDADSQKEIQMQFCEESEIQLPSFIQDKFYCLLEDTLKSNYMTWKNNGPPNKRNYDVAVIDESSPEIIQSILKFLQSDAMFLTLSNLTGLSLHEMVTKSKSEDTLTSNNDDDEPPKKLSKSSNGCSSKTIDEDKSIPKCRVEIRRWKQGCYTLIHDTDAEGKEFALDAMLFSCCEDWNEQYGGYTSYIARDDDEELLTVLPSSNALSLVYRDKDTLKFTKYINCLMRKSQLDTYYDFHLNFFE